VLSTLGILGILGFLGVLDKESSEISRGWCASESLPRVPEEQPKTPRSLMRDTLAIVFTQFIQNEGVGLNPGTPKDHQDDDL